MNNNIMDIIVSVFSKVNELFLENFFRIAQPIMHSVVLKILFLILAAFYILSIFFKNNGVLKAQDFYLVLKYFIIFIALLVITNDIENYKSFLRIFEMPNRVFQAIVLKMIYTDGGIVTGEGNNVFSILSAGLFSVIDIIKEMKFDSFILKILITAIFFLATIILLILLTGIIILSTFMSKILLSIAILVIPLYLIPYFKGIFFGWLKLYISYSLYAPFGILIGSIIISTSEYILNFAGDGNTINLNSTIALIIILIINAFLLTKIPNWINQIVGSANDNGSGAIGMMMIMNSSIKSFSNSIKGGIAGSSVGSGVSGRIGGSVGGGLGGGIAGNSGSSTGSYIGSKIGEGIGTIGNKFKQNLSTKNSGAE